MNLTKSQFEVLDKLAHGKRLVQHWDTGKCKWMPSPLESSEPTVANKATVDSLHDQGFIYSRGFVFYASGAYLDLELTNAGRTVLSR